MRNNCKHSVCSDNDSGLSMGKEFSSSFSSNHSTTQNSNRVSSLSQNISLKISIVDLRKEIKNEFLSTSSVFEVHRYILKKYGSRLADSMNYGLFIPHQINKAGKFLKEELWLSDYCSSNTLNHLEFIYKHRIVWPDKSQNEMHKKINSKINHNRFIDYVIRNDPIKVKKALDKGLDPNFHCSSGETPLTLTAKLSKPVEVITSLIAGGAHLDYRAADNLTPLHKAAISRNYEALSTLLNFGMSANCLDINGMTPLYYNLLYDTSTKCMEKLLQEHAKLGVVDKRGLKEIHQACRAGKSDHLDILLAYGAEINCRTETHLSTPLHVAAYTGQEDCVRLLLVRGADRTLVNSSGRTATQEARATGYKAISNMIKEFKDSEIHTQPSFKPIWNLNRKRSEFDITSAYLRIRNLESELAEDDSLGGDSLSSSERSRKIMSYKKINGSTRIRERCSSQHAICKSTSCNIFSDADDTSASSDMRSQANSKREKKRVNQKANVWRHSSLLSLDNDSLLDSDHNSVWEVVLQKPVNSGYGIDLDDRYFDSPSPSAHVIKNVEIGSPAFLAGLRSEDYLLEINGVNVRRAKIQSVSKLFTQNPDTVMLKILRSQKYSDASTDPSLHYEKFAYQDSKPLRSFASADKKILRTRSNYNLSCLAGKYAICESSTTLNSMSTILAPCIDQESKHQNSVKVRSTSRNKSPVNYNDGSLYSIDKSATLGRKRSQSTDKKNQRLVTTGKETANKLRMLRNPVLNYNTESLKPILKNTSASYGVRENVAIIKSRAQLSLDNDHDEIILPPAQSLITRPIGTHYIPPVPTCADYYNKQMSQSISFDTSLHPRGSSWKTQSGPTKPILVNKEPSVREPRKRDLSLVKVSTSEEDFCLPPPISFQ